MNRATIFHRLALLAHIVIVCAKKGKKIKLPQKSKAPKGKSEAPKLALAPVAPKPTTVLSCPPVPAYVPPANCAAPVCYEDMGKLVQDINNELSGEYTSFSATICPGTWSWGGTGYPSINYKVQFRLFCCGQANTCIIDGGSSISRSSSLFKFNRQSDINIQGITFQNFAGQGAILANDYPAVVIFKHNIVKNLQSDIGALKLQNSQIFIENCTFVDNDVVSGDPYYGFGFGGAISAGVSYVVVNSTTFVRNTAWRGGAISLENSALQGKCNTYKDNKAIQKSGEYGYGGAISLFSSSFASEKSIWDSNSADDKGGASFMSISEFVGDKDAFLRNSATSSGNDFYLEDGSSLVTCNIPTLSNYISSGAIEKSFCLTVAYPSNAVYQHRLLKGKQKGKVKKGKAPKRSKAPKVNLAPLAPKPTPVQQTCPVISAYVPPATCAITECYSDMANLANAINTALINNGDSFSANVCSGQYTWDENTKVDVSVNANLELFCCGKENSCIIDGNSNSPVTRNSNVFYFRGTIFLNIQGITFQNFICTTCVGTLLANDALASVVIFKHNLVSGVTSYDSGGAISLNMCQLLIENCKFLENRITLVGGNGGAVKVNQGLVVMINNTFDGNEAAGSVGAVTIGDASGKAKCNSFKNNIASQNGGAVYVSNNVFVSEHNTWVTNQASDFGGAVYAYTAAVIANGDTFAGNSATTGNDIYLFGRSTLTTCGIPSMSNFYDVDTFNKELCYA